MAKHIMKCETCKTYTMHESCVNCKSKTIEARPPKYSPEDKYAKYRRQVKKENLEKEGVI